MTDRILAIAPDGTFADTVAEALPGLEVEYAVDLVDGYEAADSGRFAVVVVGPDVDFEEAVDVAADLQGVGVVLVARRPTTRMMRSAMRASVADVLPSTFESDDLVDAVERARVRPEPTPSPPPAVADPEQAGGQVVTVFAAKGGCGKSTVATNLAAVLARRGRRVAVVDLDLQFGDAAIMFQLRPTLTIEDAVHVLDDLDEDALLDYLAIHDSGVAVLAAPLKPSGADAVLPQHIGPLLDLLRRSHDHVVVDTPAMFTDTVLAAMDETDRLIVLGGFDVPSIKNLRLGLTTIRQLGIEQDVIDVVMARANSKVGLRFKEVERTIGATIDVSIPSNRDVPLSLNHGLPIVLDKPRSPVSQAIEELADRVMGIEAKDRPEVEAEPAGLRSRIGRRAARAAPATPAETA